MPSSEAPQLLKVLEKADVDDLKEDHGKIVPVDQVPDDGLTKGMAAQSPNQETKQEGPHLTHSVVAAKPIELTDNVNENLRHVSRPPEPTAQPEVITTNPNDTPEEAALRSEMHNYSSMDEVGAIVAELDMEENASDVSYDEDDLPEEIDQDIDDDMDDEESEDETGKTKRLGLSPAYRRQMEELEKKLGLKDIENFRPDPGIQIVASSDPIRPPAAEAARRAAISRHDALLRDAALKDRAAKKQQLARSEAIACQDAAVESRASQVQHATKDAPDKKSKKKSVSFADHVDVAEEPPQPVSEPHLKAGRAASTVPTMEDTIVERSADTDPSEMSVPGGPPSTPRRVSKFKSARSSTPHSPMFPPPISLPPSNRKTPSATAPGPKDKIISDALIEHDPSNTDDPASAAAPDEKDFDEEIQRQEIAKEYYKVRNRKIRQQGGFVHRGEEDNEYGDDMSIDPIVDESAGKPKKVSRFKAVRIIQL